MLFKAQVLFIILDELDKNPSIAYSFHRFKEIRKPSQQFILDKKESIRRRDRTEVNFYCRYVLASKNKVVPLN